MTTRFIGISIVIVPALLAGCDRPDPANRPLRPGQVLDFDQLYGQNCSGCHGVDGRLGPGPPLNDGLFLAIIPDGELRRVVSEGRAGTPMSAFSRANGGALTPAQIDAVVAGIRSKWGAAASQWAEALPSYVATSRWNAAAGPAVFARSCAPCHGENGSGAEKSGPLNEPAFLALISDQALRRIVITGRPDLGMPDYRHINDDSPRPGPLTEQEIDDVVALLVSWRRTAEQPNQVAQASGESP